MSLGQLIILQYHHKPHYFHNIWIVYPQTTINKWVPEWIFRSNCHSNHCPDGYCHLATQSSSKSSCSLLMQYMKDNQHHSSLHTLLTISVNMGCSVSRWVSEWVRERQERTHRIKLNKGTNKLNDQTSPQGHILYLQYTVYLSYYNLYSWLWVCEWVYVGGSKLS